MERSTKTGSRAQPVVVLILTVLFLCCLSPADASAGETAFTLVTTPLEARDRFGLKITRDTLLVHGRFDGNRPLLLLGKYDSRYCIGNTGDCRLVKSGSNSFYLTTVVPEKHCRNISRPFLAVIDCIQADYRNYYLMPYNGKTDVREQEKAIKDYIDRDRNYHSAKWSSRDRLERYLKIRHKDRDVYFLYYRVNTTEPETAPKTIFILSGGRVFGLNLKHSDNHPDIFEINGRLYLFTEVCSEEKRSFFVDEIHETGIHGVYANYDY